MSISDQQIVTLLTPRSFWVLFIILYVIPGMVVCPISDTEISTIVNVQRRNKIRTE